MNPEYKIVNIRIFRGLNLLEDSRITDPGSFRRLQNIYRKSPGVLASRPGSQVFARGDSFQIAPPTYSIPTTTNTGLGTSLTDVVTSAISDTLHQVTNTLNNTLSKGPRGFVPRVLPRPVPNSSSQHTFPVNTAQPNVAESTISVVPIKVNSLHRMYTDFGNRRFLIGAFDFEGSQGDKLFYVDETTYTTPVTRLMATADMAVGAGGQWSFIDYYREDPDDPTVKYYVIGTNEVGKPFTVSLNSSLKPEAKLLNVQANIAGGNYLHGVRSMCVYNGSVVYGGFFRGPETATAADLEDFSNRICFSEPGEPHKIADTDGEISDVRIGDTIYEPVTHVVVNSVSSDAQGIKGQLVVFTSKRVVTYDGLPPVSGNPTGTAFHSVALGEVGCVAPNTVCQTPAGLLFLGTDGLVYIIPRFSNGGPLPVSRAIEPVFRGLTLTQQRQCAAVYDDGHYKISVPEVNYTNADMGEAWRIIDTTASPYAGAGGTEYATTTRRSQYGNAAASIPNVQYWLDVREPPQAQIDFGYVWTGPHTGMKHSCFARGSQHNDANVLWAGSAIDGTIYQVSIEGLASDYKPESPGTEVPLVYSIQTGQFDAGDIHVDKSVKSMQFGLSTTVSLNVTSGIYTSGEVSSSVLGEEFTDAFAPVGMLLDGNTTMGDLVLADPASFRFASKHPSAPRRGRTFSFGWTASPSTAAIIKFSDLSFVFEVHKRRE